MRAQQKIMKIIIGNADMIQWLEYQTRIWESEVWMSTLLWKLIGWPGVRHSQSSLLSWVLWGENRGGQNNIGSCFDTLGTKHGGWISNKFKGSGLVAWVVKYFQLTSEQIPQQSSFSPFLAVSRFTSPNVLQVHWPQYCNWGWRVEKAAMRGLSSEVAFLCWNSTCVVWGQFLSGWNK